MVAPVTVFTEREVDSKLRRSMGDSRILMREPHTTWYNTLSKSLFTDAAERSTLPCSKTNARTISQEGSSPPLTVPPPYISHQPARGRLYHLHFFFQKVNKNSHCLFFFLKQAYVPGHNSREILSYTLVCGATPGSHNFSLNFPQARELYNTCMEQQNREAKSLVAGMGGGGVGEK